jgi:hypothetical protein
VVTVTQKAVTSEVARDTTLEALAKAVARI